MKIDLSESERNAAVLLSSATSYILNQFAALHEEISNYKTLVESLRGQIQTLQDAAKTEPALNNK